MLSKVTSGQVGQCAHQLGTLRRPSPGEAVVRIPVLASAFKVHIGALKPLYRWGLRTHLVMSPTLVSAVEPTVS